LKLRYDGTLSNFAFNFNLRRYSKFKSWREFPHDEEHNTESADGRDHKRWMERENKVGNTPCHHLVNLLDCYMFTRRIHLAA